MVGVGRLTDRASVTGVYFIYRLPEVWYTYWYTRQFVTNWDWGFFPIITVDCLPTRRNGQGYILNSFVLLEKLLFLLKLLMAGVSKSPQLCKLAHGCNRKKTSRMRTKPADCRLT